MKSLFTFFTFLFFVSQSLACCGELTHRLFPLGAVGEEIYLLELDLGRHCEGKGMPGMDSSNEFWLSGRINLVKWQGDSMVVVKVLDSLNYRECRCTYDDQMQKSRYAKLAETYIVIALSEIQAKDGFIPAKAERIILNDYANSKLEDSTYQYLSSDSTFRDAYIGIFTYKNRIRLSTQEAFLCQPNLVSENRLYSIGDRQISILRLSCTPIPPEEITYRRKRFKQYKYPFWRDGANSHGFGKDHFFVGRI
ncbi:MAG: hypothetical protein MRZ79_04190 [Bacteroidia bacterium]|nr:hypothetical protein [Bacteroidia bacterium]